MTLRRFGLLIARMVGAFAVGIVRYLVLLGSLFVCMIFFRILNRTTIYGKRPRLLRRRMIVVSNHQSMLDSFAIGSSVFGAQLLLEPWLQPWHLPDKANFMSVPILRPFMLLWKAIPVGKSASGERKDIGAFFNAVREVRRGGVLHVFLEGGRSPSDELRPPKREVGGLVLESDADVLPIYVTGMHDVQTYRKHAGDPPKTWLRLFGKEIERIFDIRIGNHIEIAIGDPIPSETTRARSGDEGTLKERSVRAAGHFMEELQRLRRKVLSEHSAA